MKDSDLGWSEIGVEDEHAPHPLDTELVSWTYSQLYVVKLPVVGGT